MTANFEAKMKLNVYHIFGSAIFGGEKLQVLLNISNQLILNYLCNILVFR